MNLGSGQTMNTSLRSQADGSISFEGELKVEYTLCPHAGHDSSSFTPELDGAKPPHPLTDSSRSLGGGSLEGFLKLASASDSA